jgi:hypothetical protein
MWEKNGSRDAFRYFIHEATGGSDHIVFNNSSVAVPGIEFFTWPDQWYHADTDTPDKGDPTEMRRVAFIGATSAWVSAHLEDEMVPDLLNTVSDFGYNRVAERGLPKAMEVLEAGAGGDRSAAAAAALNIIDAAVARERDAVRSIHDIHTGSRAARALVDEEIASWDAYGEALEAFLLETAAAGGTGPLQIPEPSAAELAFDRVIPKLAPGIRGQEFNMGRYDRAQAYFQEHPGILRDVGVSNQQTQQIMNYVNGQRSVYTIRNRVAAQTGEDLTVDQVARYLEILEEIGWIEMQEGN